MRGESPWRLPVLMSLCVCCAAQPAQAQIRAVPTTSQSPSQVFPRVSGLPQKDLQDQVNALLAAREREDHKSRIDCLKTQPSNTKSTYDETIRLTYLSPRLLSVDVRASWDGCSAYPNLDIPHPITIDLAEGKKLDWDNFFVEGFLQRKGEISPLTKLYIRHAELDEECSKAMNDLAKESNREYDLWLDRQQGLMIEPSLPHVIRACAKLVAIPFNEIGFAIRDEKMRQDLLAATSPTTK